MKTGKMGLFSGLEGYFRGQNSASKESSGWLETLGSDLFIAINISSGAPGSGLFIDILNIRRPGRQELV